LAVKLTQLELVRAVVAGLADLLAVPAQRVEGAAGADQQACGERERTKHTSVSQSVSQHAARRAVVRLQPVCKQPVITEITLWVYLFRKHTQELSP